VIAANDRATPRDYMFPQSRHGGTGPALTPDCTAYSSTHGVLRCAELF